MRTIETECEHCGEWFDQPDDPGRKARYCSNAHRQAAYRARKAREKERERFRTYRSAQRLGKYQERLAALRNTNGRTAEEAATFAAKADQLEGRWRAEGEL